MPARVVCFTKVAVFVGKPCAIEKPFVCPPENVEVWRAGDTFVVEEEEFGIWGGRNLGFRIWDLGFVRAAGEISNFL
jgi:hypothetical protein